CRTFSPTPARLCWASGRRDLMSSRRRKPNGAAMRKLVYKLTEPQRRALLAVKAGQVEQIFQRNGNTFHGPNGHRSSRVFRLLQEWRLIEEVPGQGIIGLLTSRHRQRLTAAGQAALDRVTQ